MERFLILNFYNISNLKLSWCDDKLLSIEFTDEPAFCLDDLPEKIKLLYNYLQNYYDAPNFSVSELFKGIVFTDFEEKVYSMLLKIPVGEVITYSDLAELVGCKGGARAVGNAMRRNRFPILIPCHRVVGKDGIGGFTPGLELKRRLLEFERRIKQR